MALANVPKSSKSTVCRRRRCSLSAFLFPGPDANGRLCGGTHVRATSVESGIVLSGFALPAVLLALAPFQGSSEPLPQPVRTQLKAEGFWRDGCPVALSGLRLLTVSHWDFDGRAHSGHLVVNAGAADPLVRVFRKLYGLHFPIRHLQLADMYGPPRGPYGWLRQWPSTMKRCV